MESVTQGPEVEGVTVTEVKSEKEPTLKDLYDAVIELTKEVGKVASNQHELRADLQLKKKAGNF